MTVYERGNKELDLTGLPGHKLERYEGSGLMFRWRATHDVRGVCNFSAVFLTREEAEHAEATHPHGTNYAPLASMHVAEMLWVELDRVIDAIKNYSSGDAVMSASGDMEQLKRQGRAGGLAYGLLQSCDPSFYTSERDVSAEALHRWKIRQRIEPWRPTPGYKYIPLPLETATHVGRAATSREAKATVKSAPATSANEIAAKAAKIKPADQESIKKAVASGMFKPSDLTGLYSTTAAVIEYIVNQA